MRTTIAPAQQIEPSLVAEWREILDVRPALASPFFHPEYTRAVARSRPGVHVAVARHGGELMGVFPFQRTSRLPIGEPVGAPFSDYHGVATSPGAHWSLIEAVSAAGLRVWRFDHLVGTVAPSDAVSGEADSPYLDLSRGYDAYLEERRTQTKQISQIASKSRALARAVGPLHLTYSSRDEAVMERLLDWKRAQYAATGVPDVLASEWARNMLRRIWRTRESGFAGVLSALYAGEELVAVHFGMASATALHWWIPAYNPRFPRSSPGLVLLLMLAEAATDRGIQMLDLGRGDERYKRQLGSDAVRVSEGVVSVSSPFGYSWRAGRAAYRCVRRRSASHARRA